MNRYTFKAKRKDNGEWVYGYLIDDNGNYCIMVGGLDVNFDNLYTIDKDTICQCTGLQDKNGLKIYEGDILRNKRTQDGKPYGSLYKTVVWNDAGFNIRERAKQWEVIGNKFDKES